MVAIAQPRLPLNYTKQHPISALTSNARDTLTPEELVWAILEWQAFTGGPEDSPENVIMEKITPVTKVRVWVVDRDGPGGVVMLMLPEDY
jgi:hypothetical protein